MEYSLSALLGAVVGIAVGVGNYALTIPLVQQVMRARNASQTPAEKEQFEQKLSVMRRLILGFDILIFGAVGYLVSGLIFG